MDGDERERWSSDDESLQSFGSHSSHSSNEHEHNDDDSCGSSGRSRSSYYSSNDDDDYSSGSSSSYASHDNRGGFGMGAFRDTMLGVVRHRRASRTPAGSRNGSDHIDDVRLGIHNDADGYDDPDNINDEYEYEYEDHHKRRRHRHHHHGSTNRIILGKITCRRIVRLLEHYCPSICGIGSRKATTILVVSILVWILVRLGADIYHHRGNDDAYSGDASSVSLLSQLHEDRRRDAEHALGSAAGEYKKKKNRRQKKSGGNPDKLPAGCSYPKSSWVTYSFPNCNEIHEIDLRQGYNPRRRNVDETSLAAAAEGGRATGYVGSGLWRDVWKVDPRGEASHRQEYGAAGEYEYADHLGNNNIIPPAVLKVMKEEHPYDFRNNDRHRRDALVMERLSSSKYVVDIYGYCANSVLSEYVGRTLDDVIYQEEKKDRKKDDDDDDLDVKESVESVPELNRDTPIGRIRLALDVFKGISDLHDITGGPIIHADLQAKQFLIDPFTKTVRVNDFNRCRFAPRKDGDENGEMCPVKIPSAPGVNRSPEEYNQFRLTEKIDVYSAGNILYGIITGRRHWATSLKRVIKKAVINGQKPEIPDEFKREPTDKALADLIDRAYERNPKRRISAKEMVQELESLLVAAKKEEGRDSLRKKYI